MNDTRYAEVPKPEIRTTPGDCVIYADAAYSTSDLRQRGYGEETLMYARQAGVKPRLVGRRHYYLGSELIAWIASLSPAKSLLFAMACLGASGGCQSAPPITVTIHCQREEMDIALTFTTPQAKQESHIR